MAAAGMIGTLRGVLRGRENDGELLVEVGGVGYRVLAGPTTAAQMGDVDSEVLVWIHHHVREDAQILYGFASRDDRRTFEALVATHGVGPALAQAILSVHSPSSLARLLAEDDMAALCLVPGVGKKTAARLLVELKGSLDLGDVTQAAAVAVGNSSEADAGVATLGSARADTREALAALGYSVEEIAEATRNLPDSAEVSTLVQEALRSLGGRR